MEFINVLVIEGDIINQKTLIKAFSESPILVQAHFVFSVDETKDLLKERWDIIIVNYNLSSNVGGNVLSIVKKIKINIPIIVITESASNAIADEVIKAGAFVFLTKNLIQPEGIGLVFKNFIKVHNNERNTKELLKTSKEKENQLIESHKIAGLSSWEYDLNSKVFSWIVKSEIISEIYLKEKYIGIDEFLSSVIDDDRKTFLSAIDNTINHKISFEVVTRHAKKNSKSLMCFSGKGKPYLENGKVVKLHGTMMDVTKEKDFETGLIKSKLIAESATRLKQDFLANMSHEIRTPMNAILGFTDIVLNDEINEIVHKNLCRIKQAGTNLLVIINDILDFSKIEAGQLEIENVNFNLLNCLENVHLQLEEIAKNKNIRLFFSIDSDTPKSVKGDFVRLTQILLNLISNGLKFTKKGFVEVRVKLVSETSEKVVVLFEVEDTGIGIPKSIQHKVFESFAQANISTTREYGGTGLGLAICKSLVELQNGKIWVESEEGVGSVFKFNIEFNVPAQVLEQSKNETIVNEDINIQGVKVLLVEDDQMTRELVIHFLTQWGVRYEIAENGRVGVDKIISGQFDIVLMDISMPELDGYSATKEIRALESDKSNMPLIAMTANAFSKDIKECFEVGMNEHISKPFKAPELKYKIYSLVKQSKALKFKPNNRGGIVLNEIDVISNELIISIDRLEDLGQGNKEFIRDMLSLYIDETPLVIKRLKRALELNDMKELKAAIHKFRSPAGLLGINEAVKLAEFVEQNVFEASKSEEIKRSVNRIIALAQLSIKQSKEIKF